MTEQEKLMQFISANAAQHDTSAVYYVQIAILHELMQINRLLTEGTSPNVDNISSTLSID